MWTIWNKQDKINGFSAEWVFERHKHLQNEEIIFLKSINGRVVEVEGKTILASIYEIDSTLPDSEFIAEYERILSAPVEEPTPDPVEETPAE